MTYSELWFPSRRLGLEIYKGVGHRPLALVHIPHDIVVMIATDLVVIAHCTPASSDIFIIKM